VRIKFTQAARAKHRIAPSRVREVMRDSNPEPTTTRRGEAGLLWVGPDRDGNVLVVIAVPKPESGVLLVIHVMPVEWERRRR
jgi:hypothetical protein